MVPMGIQTSSYLNFVSVKLRMVLLRYVEAEKTNGRWAMMAVAGILFTEALGFAPKWFNVGYEAADQAPLPALIAVQAVVMGFIETKRLQGFKATGKVCANIY
jgi:light-harvesting complex I chlorophyll a/b binding protein 5